MPIGSTFHPHVVTISPKGTIRDAARQMREHHVGALVVADMRSDGRLVPVGIVTDRDLVIEILAEDVPPDSVMVGDIMTEELVLAKRADEIEDHLALMVSRGIKRLPVIDESGALIGIYSADDFLEKISDELSSIAKLARKQIREERRLRA